MDIGELYQRSKVFKEKLDRAKAEAGAPEFTWYPFDTLSALGILDGLLKGGYRNLLELAKGGPVLDLGCGDGDLAFFLEHLGCEVHAVDFEPPNHNHMRGVRALKEALGSNVAIYSIDLDSQFALPAERYNLVLMLGLLYHLKNPFYVMENLARRSRYCLVSTRVARLTPLNRLRIADEPLVYVVHASEMNNDATNFWTFSHTGLRRFFQRTGWDIVEFETGGSAGDSDPVSAEADERAYCLLQTAMFPDDDGAYVPGTRPDHRRCPICDVRDGHQSVLGRVDATASDGMGRPSYDLHYCGNCDLVYLSPPPKTEDLAAARAAGTAASGVEFRFLLDIVRRATALWPAGARRLRVLEVSAGPAHFARAAKRLLPSAVTVAQDSAPFAGGVCPWVDRYVVEPLTDSRFDELGPFDLTLLDSAYEQAPFPVDYLKRVRQLVAADGAVVLAGPYRPCGWTPGDGAEAWAGFPHRRTPLLQQYFSERAIRKAAAAAGLEVVSWACEHDGGQVYEAVLRRERAVLLN